MGAGCSLGSVGGGVRGPRQASRGSTQSSCCVLHRGSWRPRGSRGRGVSSPYSDALPLGGGSHLTPWPPSFLHAGLLAAGGPGPGPSEEPTGAGVRASSSHVTPTPQGCGGPRPGPPPIQPRKPPKSVAPNPPPLRPCPAPQGRKPTPAGPGALGPNRYSVCTQGVTSGASESLVTVTVQCALTLTLTAPRGADLSSLRALMSQALPRHAQHAQLRWARTTWQGGEGAPGWAPLGHALQEGRAHQRLSRSEVRTLRSHSPTQPPLRCLFAATETPASTGAGCPSLGRRC